MPGTHRALGKRMQKIAPRLVLVSLSALFALLPWQRASAQTIGVCKQLTNGGGAQACVGNAYGGPGAIPAVPPIADAVLPPLFEDVDNMRDLWRRPGNVAHGEDMGRDAWQDVDFGNVAEGTIPPVTNTEGGRTAGSTIDTEPYTLDIAEAELWGEFGAELANAPYVPMGPYTSNFVRSPVAPANTAQAEKTGLDPVNPATGEMVVREIDLTLPGYGVEFQHVRTYRSRVEYDGPLGHGWDFNLNRRLIPYAGGGCETDMLFMTGAGTTMRFSYAARRDFVVSGVTYSELRFEAPKGVHLALVAYTIPNPFDIAGAPSVLWQMTWPDGTVAEFDTAGVMVSLKDPNEQGLDFVWEVSAREADLGWRLASVTDSVGRTIDYTYGYDGRLERVREDETGLAAIYDHDSNGDLVRATSAAGKVESYEYDAGHTAVPLDYVPDPMLESACELACEPTGTSCGSGGGCDDAPDLGADACTDACGDCILGGCKQACDDYCLEDGSEGAEDCSDLCDSGCGTYCDEIDYESSCETLYSDTGVEGYCKSCDEQIFEGCGGQCVNISICIGNAVAGTVAGDQTLTAQCFASFGLVGSVKELFDQFIANIAPLVDLGQCIAAAVCSLWGGDCADCDSDTVDYRALENCNNTCVECLAHGKIDECAPGTPTCLADGVTCEQECKREFMGQDTGRNTCGRSYPASDFGCPWQLEQQCPDECGASCAKTCARTCVSGCQETCVAACDVDNCVAECNDKPVEYWHGQCEPSCVKGCIATERKRGDYEGPKYGYAQNLNHNLLPHLQRQGTTLRRERIRNRDLARLVRSGDDAAIRRRGNRAALPRPEGRGRLPARVGRAD